jgi:hypothetical protein
MKETTGGRTLSSSLLEETEASPPVSRAGPPIGQSGSPGGQAVPPAGPDRPVERIPTSGQRNAYSKPLNYKIIVLGESGVGKFDALLFTFYVFLWKPFLASRKYCYVWCLKKGSRTCKYA